MIDVMIDVMKDVKTAVGADVEEVMTVKVVVMVASTMMVRGGLRGYGESTTACAG